MDERKRVFNDNPFVKANFISRIFISWVTPLLSLGRKKIITDDDLFRPPPEEETNCLTNMIEKEWAKELAKAEPSFVKAITRMFGWKMFFASFLIFSLEASRIMQPFLIRFLLSYFKNELSFKWACIYGGILCSTLFINTILMHQFFFIVDRFGMRLKLAAAGLIYRKALRLNPKNINQKTTGNIINLLSNDAARYESSLYFLPYLAVAPFQMIAIIIIFIEFVDVSVLTGFVVFVFVLPLQALLSRIYNHYRWKVSRIGDERVSLTSEILSGIKIIKMYCWEVPFKKTIQDIRDKELAAQSKLYVINAINSSINLDFSSIITYISVSAFIHLVNTPLLPSYVVFIIAYYSRMCDAIGFYAIRAITSLVAMNVSSKRIQDFLLQSEIEPQKAHVPLLDKSPREVKLDVQNLYGSWNEVEGEYYLKNISFSLKSNELLAIVGPVGAGKSSLLLSLLGELPNIKGNINMNGSVFYVTQEPWIFSASVKQNILFGKNYDRNKFSEIVKVCALKEDLRLLPNGENTLIGEKGINLSGGQRARVSLARALYNDPDIYLFDDPLSAVDANVSKYLFENCINGYLKSKMRILVTHQIHHLPNANRIMILNNGEVELQGTFDQVKDRLYLNISAFAIRVDESEKVKVLREELVEQEPTAVSELDEFQRQISEQFSEFGSYISQDESELGISEFEERRTTGAIGWNVYSRFLHTAVPYFGIIIPFLIPIMFALSQGLLFSADYFASNWANEEEKFYTRETQRRANDTRITSSVPLYRFRERNFIIHSMIITAALVVIICRSALFYSFFLTLAKSFHEKMLTALIESKIRFYDLNPIGRIMNRFSKDLANLDDQLPHTLFNFLQCIMIILSSMLLAVYINYLILIPLIPMVILFIYIRNYFISTSREVKRIEGINRSPIYIHTNNTLMGMTTIRACKNQEILLREFNVHSDFHTQSDFAFISINRWFGIRLDILISLYTVIAIFGCILLYKYLNLQPGQVGFLLISSLNIMTEFQWTIRQSAEVENLMTSVERIVEYSVIETEKLHESTIKPPEDWPQKGEIVFDNVSFSYDERLPDVLKNITLKINAKEKVGIVGRTGAGKSTFFQTLFRMAEPSGTISIDGIDIKDVSLHDLRRKMAIIPQEPTLFYGTVRSNLDPFNEHTDQELWEALSSVQLRETVEELKDGLDGVIQKGGANLSVGEKQLFSLARAILKRTKILIIDEATANVDYKTDALVQTSIRECFKDCTVITIAHRLQTIMDSDKILCFASGRLVEYGYPYELLINEKGVLHTLVHKLGIDEAQRLQKIAEKHYTGNVSGSSTSRSSSDI